MPDLWAMGNNKKLFFLKGLGGTSFDVPGRLRHLSAADGLARARRRVDVDSTPMFVVEMHNLAGGLV